MFKDLYIVLLMYFYNLDPIEAIIHYFQMKYSLEDINDDVYAVQNDDHLLRQLYKEYQLK